MDMMEYRETRYAGIQIGHVRIQTHQTHWNTARLDMLGYRHCMQENRKTGHVERQNGYIGTLTEQTCLKTDRICYTAEKTHRRQHRPSMPKN